MASRNSSSTPRWLALCLRCPLCWHELPTYDARPGDRCPRCDDGRLVRVERTIGDPARELPQTSFLDLVDGQATMFKEEEMA